MFILTKYLNFRTLPISELDEGDYPHIDTFQTPKMIPLEVRISIEESPVNVCANQASNSTISNQILSTTTTSAMIQQLPLPSIANLSRLAASLPPAVAALVAKMPSINIKDEKPLSNTKQENKDFHIEEESPMSPLPSEDETSTKTEMEDSNKIKKDYKNFTSKNLDQIFFSTEDKNDENDSEDIDLRGTTLDDDFDDTDLRFGDASALLKSAVAELDEDVDLRPEETDTPPKPAIIPVESLQKPVTPTSSAATVSDVQALLNSLRKSGIMCGADLAGILSKVKT